MFKIHEIRLKQNFDAFDVVCKKNKLDFFTINSLVKLLQETLDYGEEFFEKGIEFNRVKNKKLLNSLIKNNGKNLFDISEGTFSVLPEVYFMLKEIYNIQKENDIKYINYRRKYGDIYFWPVNFF